MEAQACDVDSSCNGTRVCFENSCVCSLWYGWQGDDCDEAGPPTLFLLVSSSIQLALGAFLLSASLWILWRFFSLHGLRGDQNNAQVTTLALVAATSTAVVLWRANLVAILLSPERFTEFSTLNFEQETRLHQLYRLERVAVALTLLLGTLAILNVSLMWVQVARSSRLMTTKMSRHLSVYARTIYVFEGLLVVILGVCLALGQSALVTFLVVPFMLFCILTYVIGARRLVKVLDSAQEYKNTTVAEADQDPSSPASARRKHKRGSRRSATAYSRLIRSVRSTALAVSFAMLTSLVAGMTFAGITLGQGQRANIVRGRAINVVVLANEVVPAGICMGMLAILVYCGSRVRAMTHETRRLKAATGGELVLRGATGNSGLHGAQVGNLASRPDRNASSSLRDSRLSSHHSSAVSQG